MSATVGYYTTGELADLLGIETWRIQRLYELGVLADVPRLGGRRAIPRDKVADVVEALHQRGWLRSREEVSADG